MDEPGSAGDVPDHPEPPADAPAVDPADLYRSLADGEPIRLLDVRDRDEVDAWRIDGPSVTATHVPLTRFLQAQVTDAVADVVADVAGEGPITAVCAEGDASDYVAGLLVEAGVEARNLAGGMAGWARVYRATEIATDPTIVQYLRPSSGCLAYMVVDGGEAAVVDPLRAFTDRYRSDADERGAAISAVVDTHLHADHVSGLRTLAEATGAARFVPAETRITYPVEELADGESVTVGDAALRAVALPGHTPEMTGLAVGDVLLSGDSLFVDGVARPDLQAAEAADRAALAADLHLTLVERLAAFDDDTLVAPGHASADALPDDAAGVTARLGELREREAIFESTAEAFVERLFADLPPPPANAERIVAINRGDASADAETAFELELGPNNCAAGTLVG